MHHLTSGDPRRRAVLLWTTVSALGGALGTVAGPLALDLVRAPGRGFAELLVQGCAVVTAVAVVLIWAATTDVVLGVLRSPSSLARRVGPLRSALLAACGVAVLSTTAPASATPADGPDDRTATATAGLDGLPLPDRALGGSAAHDPAPTSVRVRPGDSLWSIADHALGPGASEADVAAYWQRLVAHNAAALGAAPDLIHPGQQLDLPPR